MSLPAPVQRAPHLVEIVADRLRDRILGEGVDGEKLPTEKALALAFAVSRTVVREAVMVLKSEGLLATRQGAGIFIARARARRAFRIVTDRAANKGFQALYELRFGMEVAAAELAAARRTPDDLVRLESALALMGDPATRSAADLRFHVALAEATHNRHYRDFQAFLADELADLLANAVANTQDHFPARVDDVIAEHARVLDAIRAERPDRARAAMAFHLRASAGRLSLRVPEIGGTPR